MAAACVHVVELDAETCRVRTRPVLSHISVETGVDATIRELAVAPSFVVGHSGSIVFEARKPDGRPRKLLDVSSLCSLGWQAGIPLQQA